MTRLNKSFITAGIKESGQWFVQTDASCCGIVAALNLYRWYCPKKNVTNKLIKKIAEETYFTEGGIYTEYLHRYFCREPDFLLADYKNRVNLDWIDEQLNKNRVVVLVYVTADGASYGHYTMITEKVYGEYTLINNGEDRAECLTSPADLAGWLAEEHTSVGCTVFSGGWAFGKER